VVAGIAQGVQLNATFSLTISQSGGTLSGSWSLAGNLTDGVVVLPVGGSGTITGTIAPGTNPSINVTIRTPQCPNVQENFSGSLDSANDIITLSGPIHWFDDDCTILLSWPTVVILSR
jgi:hypothetical protein